MISAWYSARTKPKHEHIAAANLRKHLGLEVFLPRLRLEKITRRGLVRVVEPLFPCYLFVQCAIAESLHDIQHTSGINKVVHFGGRIPAVPDAIIEDLRSCFESDDIIAVAHDLAPGDEVTVAGGAFAGMSAQVLKRPSCAEKGSNLARHPGAGHPGGSCPGSFDVEKEFIGGVGACFGRARFAGKVCLLEFAVCTTISTGLRRLRSRLVRFKNTNEQVRSHANTRILMTQ